MNLQATVSNLMALNERQTKKRLAVVFAVVVGSSLVGTAWALQPQESDPEPTPVEVEGHPLGITYAQSPARTILGRYPGSVAVIGSNGDKNRSEFQKIQMEVTKAKQQLRKAESEADKEEATEALKDALGADYDARLNEYEDHLDQLAKELDDMRSKLRKKRAAKSEMVNLRLKQVMAEAEDLGWPSRVSGSSWGVRTGFPIAPVAIGQSIPTPPKPPAPPAPAGIGSKKKTVWGTSSTTSGYGQN